ncbi:MAG: hypothetical protein WCS94_12575 [Verrucomicrobiota bacterium]
MSKLEDVVKTGLLEAGVTFECQNEMPLDVWPWKKPRSHKLKCDFFLPKGAIYIEVKGFMTIHAMAKMSWLCRQQGIRYYILQGSEEDWNPYLNSPLKDASPARRTTRQNIEQQVTELQWLIANNPDDASHLSLARLKNYIQTRIDEYTKWNGEWC